MPLSDAAKALLNRHRGDAPAVAPTKVKEKKADRTPAVNAQQQGFRDRAAREAERFLLATDSEFWLTFCFRDATSPTQFAQALKVPVDLPPYQSAGRPRYIKGPALTAAVGDRTKLTVAERVKQMLAVRGSRAGELTSNIESTPLSDVLDDLPEETGDLELDSLAEFRAIHTAFMKTAQLQTTTDVLDSPHWLAAYWPSREGKELFLTASGLDVTGSDKYLDGHEAARILGIRLGG